MGNGRVFVGYCSGGKIDECFMDSMTRAEKYDDLNRKILAIRNHEGGLYITMNRNRMGEKFLQSDCEWFWSLDTDMQFNPDAIYKLIDCADPVERPVVSALYFGYIGTTASLMQPVPIWFDEHPDGMPHVVTDITQGQLRPLKNIGFGCCIIHRSVFEKMDEHYGVVEHEGELYHNDFTWFGHDPIWHTEVVEYRGHKFRKLVHAGEDVTFCQRARKLGFTIWGNPDVETNHLKARFENAATFQMGPYTAVRPSPGSNGETMPPGQYLRKLYLEERQRVLGVPTDVLGLNDAQNVTDESKADMVFKRAAERLLAMYTPPSA